MPWSTKASKSASLATNPNSSGMPAIDPAATAATASTAPQPGPGRGSRRTSRVPRWWSTMPTTMKAAALKAPWASSITQPAVVGRRSAPAEHGDHQPELADRAEGEEQLEVVLAQRPQPAADHRHDADGDDHRAPQVEVDERRGEPGDEVHPGLDHRRRVQVGAHRRRRDHRPGQPRVERHLRRLGEGAEQDQHDGDRRRVAAGRVGEDRAELVRPGGLAEDDEAGEHRQRAGAGDQERLQGGGPGLGILVVVADEQERRDRRELPEPVQHEQVVGDDEARPSRRRRARAARAGAPCAASGGRSTAPRRRRRARRCRRRARASGPRSRRGGGRGRGPSWGTHSTLAVRTSPSTMLGSRAASHAVVAANGMAATANSARPEPAVSGLAPASTAMPTTRKRARRAITDCWRVTGARSRGPCPVGL